MFTPENPSVVIRDESLLRDVPAEAEVIRFPIWEPYEAFGRLSKVFSGNENTKTDFVAVKKQSLFSKLSVWIRGNLFIPDPRKFWVRPSVKFLLEYLEKNRIETIITTGPPHSMHLIGYKLKKKKPDLKWIVDMRDPWSEWGFLETLRVSSFARILHKRLEGQVLKSADTVLTVTPSWVKMLERLSGRSIKLLTNGYDEADFSNIVFQRTGIFTIRHVGIINERCDPRPFLLALESLCRENLQFREAVKVEFIGTIHPGFKDFVENNKFLKSKVSFVEQMPHRELLTTYGSASLLLLVLTGYKEPESYLPGKLFEYLATGLPIMGVGPKEGDAAFILADTKAGDMMESEDSVGIQDKLNTRFSEWKVSGRQLQVSNQAIHPYSRRRLTERLVMLLMNTSD